MEVDRDGCEFGRALKQSTESTYKFFKALFEKEIQELNSDYKGIKIYHNLLRDKTIPNQETKILEATNMARSALMDSRLLKGIILAAVIGQLIVGGFIIKSNKDAAKSDTTVQNINQYQTVQKLDKLIVLLEESVRSNINQRGGK
jgi:hypothetical protein